MEAGILQVGDAAGALALVEEIGRGTEIGTLIGHGPAAVGARYGVARVPVVKNQSVAGYDPRGVQGMGVTYAMSPMGADHTAGWTVGACLEAMGGSLDPLSPDGQVACSRDIQIHTAAADCTGMCQFAGFPLSDIAAGAEGLREMLEAHYGTDFGPQSMAELGKRVLRTERGFNLQAGLTAGDDRLPPFFYSEGLPPHNKPFLVKNEAMDTLFDF
jgi:aldehyde:ferredoxin oxidoreductase